jgi:hypothetical protein
VGVHRTLLVARDGGIETAGDAVYELNLGSTAPEVVAAELSLLATGLADSLTFRHERGRIKVKIERGPVRDRATAESRPGLLALILSETELEYWRSYFLRYYREGAADVDHIDVEATSIRPAGGVIDLRVRVARAVPPVSPEEARRRLGG